MEAGHNGEGGVNVMVLYCGINECSVCFPPWMVAGHNGEGEVSVMVLHTECSVYVPQRIKAGHNGEGEVSVMVLHCAINECSVCVPQ